MYNSAEKSCLNWDLNPEPPAFRVDALPTFFDIII